VYTTLEIGLAFNADWMENEELGAMEIISLGPGALTAGWVMTDGYPLCPDCSTEGLALGVLEFGLACEEEQ